jgi:hypothetical protein
MLIEEPGIARFEPLWSSQTARCGIRGSPARAAAYGEGNLTAFCPGLGNS